MMRLYRQSVDSLATCLDFRFPTRVRIGFGSGVFRSEPEDDLAKDLRKVH